MSEYTVQTKMRVLGRVQYPQDDPHPCSACNWDVLTLFRIVDEDGDTHDLCPECFATQVLDLPMLPVEEEKE